MKISILTKIVLLLFALIVFAYLIFVGKSVFDKMIIDPNPKISNYGKMANVLIIQYFDGIALKNQKPSIVVTVTDMNKIRFIASHLKAIPHPRNNYISCACTGNPWIIFKQNEKELCSITVHHAELINCSWDNRGGYKLNPDVIPELKTYFKELNLPEYVDEK
jgi:hypothetical protein